MKRPSVYLISLPLPALMHLCVQKLQDELACCYSVRQLSDLAIKATTFFSWIRSQRIQNSAGQMLNQDISTFLNTLLIAKAKWFARALIPEPSFSPGIFSHPLSPPSAPSSCVLATRGRMFQGSLTLPHCSASTLALP